MIVVDTNVLSEAMLPEPNRAVVAWAASVTFTTTAITVGELRRGIARLPDGTRKRHLDTTADAVLAKLGPHGVLPYDEPAARRYGDLTAVREAAGRPIGTADAQIAAICLSRGATLATRNTRDFELIGLDVVNPWKFSPPSAT